MKNNVGCVGYFTRTGFCPEKTTTSAVINFDATTEIDALPKAENKTVIAAIDTQERNCCI